MKLNKKETKEVEREYPRLKIIKAYNIFSEEFFHVVIREMKDYFICSGGSQIKEFAVWDYLFREKHKIPQLNYEILKASLVEKDQELLTPKEK